MVEGRGKACGEVLGWERGARQTGKGFGWERRARERGERRCSKGHMAKQRSIAAESGPCKKLLVILYVYSYIRIRLCTDRKEKLR